MTQKNYTVAIIKSPTVGRGQALDVLADITKGGFVIEKLEYKKLCPATIAAFYHEHVGKDFYPRLERSVSRTKVVLLLLSHPDSTAEVPVTAAWRTFIGATNSAAAAPGTLRAKYGGHRYLGATAEMSDNAVHGSADAVAAKYEADVLFSTR